MAVLFCFHTLFDHGRKFSKQESSVKIQQEIYEIILHSYLKPLKMISDCRKVSSTLLVRSSRQQAAAEGRNESHACVVNMCVLGEKSCFRQNSVFHSIDFKYFIHSRFEF